VQRHLKTLFTVVLLVCFARAAWADDCAICGQPISGTIYQMTDGVTGQKVEVCSNCTQLPLCFICGLPVKNGVHLSDGRWLCSRDAQSAVMDIDDVQHTFGQVHDYLDHLYARFTSFPTNVDVSVIDRVDVDSMFQVVGNSFESPDVLGVTESYATNGVKRYKISLLTGQPLSQLEEVCAHELSHAWVGENVPPERHARIDRDAEEGFCEMMGYLTMDAMGEEGEKKRVLENAYTRGQVQLFIAAEQEYGFDEVLDWMQYGVTGHLEEGHLDEVRDIKMPTSTSQAVANIGAQTSVGSPPPHAPPDLQLQGIMWGSVPSAIINGRSFFSGDEQKVPLGQSSVEIHCLSITKNAVQIRNVDSGKDEQLNLPSNP
jgi:Protein DA1